MAGEVARKIGNAVVKAVRASRARGEICKRVSSFITDATDAKHQDGKFDGVFLCMDLAMID